MILPEDLDNWFRYHPPGEGDPARYAAIRTAGHRLAGAILANTPPGADQSAALRKAREAVMTANAAVACGGR